MIVLGDVNYKEHEIYGKSKKISDWCMISNMLVCPHFDTISYDSYPCTSSVTTTSSTTEQLNNKESYSQCISYMNFI